MPRRQGLLKRTGIRVAEGRNAAVYESRKAMRGLDLEIERAELNQHKRNHQKPNRRPERAVGTFAAGGPEGSGI